MRKAGRQSEQVTTVRSITGNLQDTADSSSVHSSVHNTHTNNIK